MDLYIVSSCVGKKNADFNGVNIISIKLSTTKL